MSSTATGVPTATQSSAGLKAATHNLAVEVIGKHPKTWGAIFVGLVVLLVILLIMYIYERGQVTDCKNGNKMSNLVTGGNNPQWQYQAGDAGWGGPMHTTVAPGQSQPLAASAGAAVSVPAPTATFASAKNMGDDALVRVMNGERS